MQLDPIWAYIVVFLGSLIEGESVILMAGFLAHEEYLSLPKIIVISFVATLFADQVLYHVGRHYGNHVLDKFPAHRKQSDRAFYFLKKYDTLFLLSFRFIYGIRIISPVIIGTSGISILRFTILNLVAALIWSVGSCVIAYYFAHLIMEELTLIPKIFLGLILIGGGISYSIHHWRKKKQDVS